MGPIADKRAAAYLRSYAITVLVSIVLVAALVWLVDPYGIYGTSGRVGFNAKKPAPTRYRGEIKLARVVAGTDVFILGNSRAEIGFNPQGAVLSRAQYSSYNLALAGTGISSARGQLEYLERTDRRPKIIVLGIEFLDFLVPASPRSAVEPQIVRKHPVEHLFWRFDTLLSLTSLNDALRTLSIQQDEYAETTTVHGFNPFLQYRAHARREGYHSLFVAKAKEEAAVYLKKSNSVLDEKDFDHLTAILELSASSGVASNLVIYPYHAQLVIEFEAAGLWNHFTAWKARLTAIVSNVQDKYPSAQIALYDFSGYSVYHCERIPLKGDRTSETRWYWEGGHFKEELGELMLQRMLGDSIGANSNSEFGMRLQQRAISVNERRIAAERVRCLEQYPELFKETVALVAAERERQARSLSRGSRVLTPD